MHRELNVLPEMRSWYQEHFLPAARRHGRPQLPPATKGRAAKVPATELDLQAIAALKSVRFPPATAAKRFARNMQGEIQLTERQRAFLWFLAQRFRRQISDKAVLAEATRRHAAQEAT